MVPLGLYAGQLTLNWAWPPIFFGSRQMGVVSASLAPGDGRGGRASFGDMGITPRRARARRQEQRPVSPRAGALCGASTAAFPPAKEPDGLLAPV